jgi:lipid-binding SYLF domain-containing protein
MHIHKCSVFLAVAIILGFSTPVARATERYTEAHLLVDNSSITLQQFSVDPNMGPFRELASRAYGVLIIPQLLKGGFVVGGSGGSGILLARDVKTSNWRGPAFYSIGSVSLGLQIGAESSQVIMVVMTPKGLNSLMNSSFKLGADVSVAAGPVGRGAKAATADILAYTKSKGAFGGFSVEGAVIQVRDGWNTSYYTVPATPAEIVISGAVENPHGAEIRQLITEVGAPTSQKVRY